MPLIAAAFSHIQAWGVTMAANIQDGIVYSPYPSFDMKWTTFYSFFEEKFSIYEKKIAIVDGEQTITFSDLLKRLKKCLTGFTNHGVLPGDRVMVNTDNSADILVAIFTLICHGAVVVFPGAKRTAEELSYQIKETGAKLVITDSVNISTTLDALTYLSNNVNIFTVSAIPGYVSLSAFDLLSETPVQKNPAEDLQNILAAIGYTSGTTGPTKGAQFSQYNMLAGILGTINSKFVDQGDVTVIMNSICFPGNVRLSLAYLSCGASLVIAKMNFSALDLADAVRRNKVSHISGTACTLQSITKEMYDAGVALPCVQRIVYGASPLSAETVAKMRKMFSLSSLRTCYGLTEAGGPVAITLSNEITNKNLGFPAPMVMLKVMDCDSGKSLNENEIGEMCVKMPSLMKGYINKPNETAEVLSSDGWLRTGDLGYYDNEGRLHYVDRIKDLIKCQDGYVSPTELEDILLSHAAVQEACVVGVPHPTHCDQPTAFVVLEELFLPTNDLANELKTFVEERTPKHKHLYGGIFFIDTIPRNSNGKPLKTQLRCRAKKALGYDSTEKSIAAYQQTNTIVV